MTADAIARERASVVEEARSWVGTRFAHAQRMKHVGVDCAQLLVAVYCGLGLVPPVEPGYYPPDWFLHSGDEKMLCWIPAHCRTRAEPEVGDVALFRYGRALSHAGIVVQTAPIVHVVHSFVGLGVCEMEVGPGQHLGSRLGGYWTLTRWLGDEDAA